MTLPEILTLLNQTTKRLEAEQQSWYRKRKRMSDNDNEKWNAIHKLGDEISALYSAAYYIREMIKSHDKK